MYLDDLPVDSVRVEVYADGLDNNAPFCQLMERKAALPECSHANIPVEEAQ